MTYFLIVFCITHTKIACIYITHIPQFITELLKQTVLANAKVLIAQKGQLLAKSPYVFCHYKAVILLRSDKFCKIKKNMFSVFSKITDDIFNPNNVLHFDCVLIKEIQR